MKTASVEMGNLSNAGNKDMTRNQLPDAKPEKWIDYFQFKYSRDTASEARDALLVVAALIVQVTFQAGINPPNYIVQNAEVSTSSLNVFLVVNTMGLSAAMTVIEYLTRNMPFQRELRISMACMMFGYGWSLANTRPVKGTTIALLISSLVPFLARFLPNLFKRIRKTCMHVIP